jgi:hypothetical protein
MYYEYTPSFLARATKLSFPWGSPGVGGFVQMVVGKARKLGKDEVYC